MIYKIISGNNDLPMFIPLLKEEFNILFTEGCLYLAQKKIDLNFNIDVFLKNKKNKRFLVIEVDENNLANESNNVIEWCKNQFVQLDFQKFEKEQKDKIRETFYFLESFEKELKQIEEGGVKSD